MAQSNDLLNILNLACLKHTGFQLPADGEVANVWKYQIEDGVKVGKCPKLNPRTILSYSSCDNLSQQINRRLICDALNDCKKFVREMGNLPELFNELCAKRCVRLWIRNKACVIDGRPLTENYRFHQETIKVGKDCGKVCLLSEYIQPMLLAIGIDEKEDMAHKYIREFYKKVLTWGDDKPEGWKTYKKFWAKYDEYLVGEEWIDNLKYLNPTAKSQNGTDKVVWCKRKFPNEDDVWFDDVNPNPRGFWTYRKYIKGNHKFKYANYLSSTDIETYVKLRKSNIMETNHKGENPMRAVEDTIDTFLTKTGSWRKRSEFETKMTAIRLRWKWITKLGGLNGFGDTRFVIQSGSFSVLDYTFRSDVADWKDEIMKYKEGFDNNWYMLSIPSKRHDYNRWKQGTFTFTPTKRFVNKWMRYFEVSDRGHITQAKYWEYYSGGSNKRGSYSEDLDFKVMMRIMGVRKDDDIKLKLVKEFC